MKLPKGTLFSKYAPYIFEDLAIKDDTLGTSDFFATYIADAVASDSPEDSWQRLDTVQQTGESLPMDFTEIRRDGTFEEDQLFAVWEPADVRALISELQNCLSGREAVERLWLKFGCIPVDGNECLEEPFLRFPVGTHREAVWHWFEEQFDVRVADLLWGREEGAHVEKHLARLEARNSIYRKTLEKIKDKKPEEDGWCRAAKFMKELAEDTLEKNK